MMENKKNKNLPITSGTVFSSLGAVASASASACCVGPGVVACGTVCAPACGASVGFSIFGLSSSVVAHWMSDYWMVFLILSVISFGVAYQRIFRKPASSCHLKRNSKTTFYVSLCLSLILVTYSVLQVYVLS